MPAETATVDNGNLTDLSVSGDTAGSGFVQNVKLAIATDGSDTPIPADATNGLSVNVTKMPVSTSGAQSAVSVGTTATLLCSALSTRKCVTIRPGDDIFIGYSNSVTVSNGMPVYGPQDSWEERDFKGAIYGICASGTVNTRVLDAQ